jgi:hypothetical protein
MLHVVESNSGSQFRVIGLALVDASVVVRAVGADRPERPFDLLDQYGHGGKKLVNFGAGRVVDG